MPSVTINEKDYTIFNKGYETDNIVYVPGFTIKGPYDEPVLLATYADLVNTFGNLPPENYYASSSTDATKQLCSSWEYAAQLLQDSFMVLFQRIVPYKVKDNGSGSKVQHTLVLGNLDEDLLIPANITIMEGRYNKTTESAGGEGQETTYTTSSESGAFLNGSTAYIPETYPYYDASAQTPSIVTEKTNGFKISEKSGGTYGNRLELQFVLNTARNKLFYKLIDTYKGTTVLEYKEICSIITNSNKKISWKYLFEFAKGFVSAINSSEYIKTDATVDKINNYIVAILNYINAHDNRTGGTGNGIVLTTTQDGYITFAEGSVIPWNDFSILPMSAMTTDSDGKIVPISGTDYQFHTYYTGDADHNTDSHHQGYYAQYSCFIDTLLVHSSASFDSVDGVDDSGEYKVSTSQEYLRSSWEFANSRYVINEKVTDANEINNIGLAIGVFGKDYTVNDAITQLPRYTYTEDSTTHELIKSEETTTFDASANIKFLCDTLVYGLNIISDIILYDVKFVTNGAIPIGASADKDGGPISTGLVPTIPDENGVSYNQIVANFCKTRGECLAVLNPGIGETDPQGVPDSFLDVAGVPASYTAAYAPWCVMTLFNGYQKWCPPSLIFLDALAESVLAGNPVYLPPAGVNRASLPKVVEPEYKIGSTILNDWQDKNQLRNINPIMNLNTYGYVIFGQRTLYDVSDAVTSYRSALQELGVRLVTIELKKKIRQVATGLIFQYNNIHTWNEFKAGLKPLMEKMLCEGALQRYQIIMDETTTSTDDIDDNIIRGTVKIVPGRAAEDFIISFELYRSNVTFDDEEEVNGY